MSNEATSLLPYNRAVYPQSLYETANTIQCVEAAIRDNVTERITQVALVTVTLQFTSEDGKVPFSHDMLAQSIYYYFDGLRCLVRKTDVVYILNSTFYFLLLNANSEGSRIVQTRLWDALLWRVHNTDEHEILRPCFMAIGHAAYPELPDVHECMMAASEPCYSFDLQPEKMIRKAIPHGHSKEIEQPVSLPGIVVHEEELTALARELGVPYLSLLPRKKTEQVQRLVTLKLAHELQCYPLGRERGTLTVALSNPQDRSILERLHEATGLRIFPVLAHPQELQAALSQLV